MAAKVKPIPEGYHTATPVLTTKDPARALDFYKRAFGAKETMRFADPSGRIMHAEIEIGDSRIMIGPEVPQMGSRSPETIGGTPVCLYLYVEDVDKVFNQAVTAGGKADQPVQDMFYGDRAGRLADPFGHLWQIATRKENLSMDELRKRAQQAA